MANILNPTEDQDDDASDGRGPAYPNISLEKAVERAEQLKSAGVARTALPLAGILKIWDYKSPSGPARRQVAAVKYYGLLDTIGSGKDRKFKLSDLALKIVLDKVPDSSARSAALKEAALKPPIFGKLLDNFPLGIGTDAGFETFLTLTCQYNEDAAKTVLSVFRDTLRYAGLDKPANMSPEANEKGVAKEVRDREKGRQNQDVAVGDFVQIEIDDAFQLERAARVRAIQDHEGKKWVFIDGSESGVPMNQVVLEKKASAPAVTAPTLALPQEEPPAKGMRKEVFDLDEGTVVLTFPESLSATSFEELDAYLKVFLGKMRRRAGAAN